jgi:molybdopterin-guanine dinucleotide biosynthesis protein A
MNQSESSAVSLALTAIVLAGGQSSRMGQDKALLTIDGVPLLRLVCDIASSLCNPVYVVTPWPEHYQGLLPASCQFILEVPLPIESASNVESSTKVTSPLSHGPLVGFAQGLAQVQTNWVLLLACDLPRLQVEVLQNWAVGLDSVAEEVVALLTHHAKGWNPLCGFYRRSCLPALTDYINQGGRSFQHWLAQHPVQLLPLPDAQMLFNCNTPADFASVISNGFECS